MYFKTWLESVSSANKSHLTKTIVRRAYAPVSQLRLDKFNMCILWTVIVCKIYEQLPCRRLHTTGQHLQHLRRWQRNAPPRTNTITCGFITKSRVIKWRYAKKNRTTTIVPKMKMFKHVFLCTVLSNGNYLLQTSSPTQSTAQILFAIQLW